MMAILNRATDQQQDEWIPVPEGLWRWIVGVPELKPPDKFGYRVRFPLSLTEDERKRLEAEADDPPEGKKQSRQTSYTVGLSLGYVQRDGQYKSTKLIDFLAACMGSTNTKKFRAWIAEGGGPPRPADKDDQKAELENIADWLKWWENLEVYGTVTHAEDVALGQTFTRFAGPMPVGSLPGQAEADYQALGRGKLRAMLAETEVAEKLTSTPAKELVATGAPKAQHFAAQGIEARRLADDMEDLPF